jgi:hypothetical protein
MNPTVEEINFKCSRSVIEDPNNLFGEIMGRFKLRKTGAIKKIKSLIKK